MQPDLKQRYREFCEAEPSLPVYLQDWWLDAVCGKSSWDVRLSFDNAQRINGVLALYRKRWLGIADILTTPPLTGFSGIWLRLPEKLKLHSRYSLTQQICTELVRQLPKAAFFQQKYHYSLQDWLPFHRAGFRQTTLYTYVIEDLSNPKQLYKQMKGSVRTDIRKAEKQVQISTGDDVSAYYELCHKSFSAKGMKIPYSIDLLSRVDAALAARGARTIYFAKDEYQRIHAACYIIRDRDTAYYLGGGSDPALRQSGAVALLLWTAIQDSAKSVKQFDFEGSMTPELEYLFRSFGGTQKPYFRIVKAGNRFWEWIALITGKL